MSVHHIAAVADLAGLSVARKCILYGLAVDAARDGRVNLDRTRLRLRTGLSERSLRDNLRFLSTNGWLRWSGEGHVYLKLER